MALQALKETRGAVGGICRLPSPPASPPRRAASSSSSGASIKSKILATFDAELEALRLESLSLGGSFRSASHEKSASVLSKTTKSANSINIQSQLTVSSLVLKEKATNTSDTINVAPPKKARSSSKRPNSTASSSQSISSMSTLGLLNALQADVQPPAPEAVKPLYWYKDYSPEPTVVYTCHEEEANELVQCLQGPLGFDMEWRVVIRRSSPFIPCPTALLQLCDTRTIILIHLSAMKRMPQKVKEIIESPSIVKTGANIRNDGHKLYKDFGVLASNLVELGALAKQADPVFRAMYKRNIVSLAIMVDTYTNKALDKGPVRIGNWETYPLTELQKTYAANDTHAGLTVYNRLMELAELNNVVLEPDDFSSDLRQDYVSGRLKVGSGKIAGPFQPTQPAAQSHSLPTASSTAPTSSINSATRPTFWVNGNPVKRWHSKVDAQPGDPTSSQQVRAYKLWYKEDMPLGRICATLRSADNPLAESTVISYVIRAIQANPNLPFDMDRLKALAQVDARSWTRHGPWLMEMDFLLAPPEP